MYDPSPSYLTWISTTLQTIEKGNRNESQSYLTWISTGQLNTGFNPSLQSQSYLTWISTDEGEILPALDYGLSPTLPGFQQEVKSSILQWIKVSVLPYLDFNLA